MTRIILPAQIAFFAGGLLMAVQFARERFFLPALAPLIYNLGIIAGGLLLRPWLGVEGFAWGVLVGAFLGNFAVQVAGARRLGLRFRPAWSWTHPDLKEYVRLTLPLIVGLTMTFSTEFLFRCFGSYLPAGGIAVLNFSLRVMLILVGLFGQAVGTASFPTMARLAAENNLPELNRLLNRTLRYLALLIPVAAMLMVLSREVVRILFQRGRFDPAATTLTAEVLVWFLAGAFAFAAYTVVVRGYYATRNTLVPALFGTGCGPGQHSSLLFGAVPAGDQRCRRGGVAVGDPAGRGVVPPVEPAQRQRRPGRGLRVLPQDGPAGRGGGGGAGGFSGSCCSRFSMRRA